jgi:hypothetical protein
MKRAAAIRNLLRGSWLIEESNNGAGEVHDELIFATREHGSVGDETPGREDIVHAREMKLAILANVDGVTAYIDTCDEWVSLIVRAA